MLGIKGFDALTNMQDVAIVGCTLVKGVGNGCNDVLFYSELLVLFQSLRVECFGGKFKLQSDCSVRHREA